MKSASLFDFFGVATPEPVAPAKPNPVVDVYVPHADPVAAADPPEGVRRIRESYAFVEASGDDWWVGCRRGERTNASILMTDAELRELRGRIDAAITEKETAK
jgi:hypothetical protein